MYLILLSWSLHPLLINNWILYGYTNYYDSCFFSFIKFYFCVCADLYFDWFLLLCVACLLSVCHCLFSDYARQYLLKMGGQLDKRMFHWQPATCYIFSCSLLSVIWRIKYYYYRASSTLTGCTLKAGLSLILAVAVTAATAVAVASSSQMYKFVMS